MTPQSPKASSISGTSQSQCLDHLWYLKAMILNRLIHPALCKSGGYIVALCGDPTIALVCGAEQVGARLAGCVVFLL